MNIGSRQTKRDRGNNVIDVNYNREEIVSAIKHWLNADKAKSSDVYGGGDAGKQIAGLLATQPLRFHKTIAY